MLVLFSWVLCVFVDVVVYLVEKFYSFDVLSLFVLTLMPIFILMIGLIIAFPRTALYCVSRHHWQAPFVVLQVVRHMRGLHWQGEREYVLSFSDRPSVTIGSGPDCDLCLPDPSLSRTHSRIDFKGDCFQVRGATTRARSLR